MLNLSSLFDLLCWFQLFPGHPWPSPHQPRPVSRRTGWVEWTSVDVSSNSGSRPRGGGDPGGGLDHVIQLESFNDFQGISMNIDESCIFIIVHTYMMYTDRLRIYIIHWFTYDPLICVGTLEVCGSATWKSCQLICPIASLTADFIVQRLKRPDNVKLGSKSLQQWTCKEVRKPRSPTIDQAVWRNPDLMKPWLTCT